MSVFNARIVNNGSCWISLRISDQVSQMTIHSDLLQLKQLNSMEILIYFIRSNVTGQHDRQDERWTGQLPNQFGHRPLTGRYFEPCAATLCDRSYATHQQVQPQTYRFIAPRPAASHTSIQPSTLPCQHPAENIPEKLMESPKPVETSLERSYVSSTTTTIDWIERVKTFINRAAMGRRGSCFTRGFFFFSVVLSVTRPKLLSATLRMTQLMVFIRVKNILKIYGGRMG